MNYFNYCGNCGSPLAAQDATIYRCSKGHLNYNNPKAATSIMILNNDFSKVLLAKRAYEPQKGTYDTVGGFIDYNEPPEAGAKREAREETGLEVEIIDLLGAYTNFYVGDVTTTSIVYSARVISGEPKAADDVAELEWVDMNQLPPLESCAWTCMPELFEDLQQWVNQQGSQQNLIDTI